MENRVSVSKEVLDFLTGVHDNRDNEKQRKEAIFDRAFELAYKDMSTHTVKYTGKTDQNSPYNKYICDNSIRCTENKKKIRDTIKNYISQNDNIFGNDYLSTLNKIFHQGEFDDWHQKACETLVKIDCKVSGLKLKGITDKDILHQKNLADFFEKNGMDGHIFTIGQAQKLINMMVKYLYIYYQCEGLNTLEWLKKYAHIPIDRFVLKAAFQQEDYKGTPWSQIETYEDYISCKNEIDKHAGSEGYVNGFQWELAEWPFRLKIK